MRKVVAGLGSLVVAAGLTTTFALSAGAQPSDSGRVQARAVVSDDLAGPAEEKRRELREEAIKQVIAGDAKVRQRGASKVVKLGKTTPAKGAPAEDQYVELAREKTDKIFVVLAEFGDERHPSYPDQDTDPNTPGPATWNGPLHNKIPEPDRTKDNKTIWQPDFNRAHFEELYFGDDPEDNSLKNYYEKQSSGRYSVDGLVTNWVKVRYNEARYGRSNGFPCPGSVCSNSQNLIPDAVNAWVADQKAGGKTDAQIAEELKSFDVWDRNDYDADGNFNEPDGYIDHFQIVHAGGDQADGDPYQGEDAIWSHRSKAFTNLDGTAGPDFNKDGGVQIGTTGLWIADYTMQPENGGVSVFAHEYAHDLGLPDEYDTTAATGTQENAVNWWSIMAQSRVSGAGEPAGGYRARRLRRVGQAPARLARLRGRPRGHGPHARPRPARVQQRQGAGRRDAAARQARDHAARRAARRDQAVVVRSGQRGRVHADPPGHAPGRQLVAVAVGALEHRGLRSRRL